MKEFGHAGFQSKTRFLIFHIKNCGLSEGFGQKYGHFTKFVHGLSTDFSGFTVDLFYSGVMIASNTFKASASIVSVLCV